MTTESDAYQAVIYDVADGVASVTFNRPDALNAFNRQMTREVIEICQAINDRPDIRVVIFSGAGERAFSVGLDLKERASTEAPPPAITRAGRLRPVVGMFHLAIAAIECPTIAAVDGFAVGGGLEAAMACDFRIATEDARFGLPEVRHGMMPGGGGTQRLARLVGIGNALKLALTGQPIDAQEAYRIGLVAEIVPRTDLMSTALAFADMIKAGAPVAARFIKEAVNKGFDLPLAEGIRLEVDLSTILSQTEDAKEGPRAFAEKRRPEWKGR